MQPPSWTEFLHCCVCVSKFNSHTYAPVSLSCGHTVCLKCLAKLKSQICPYDKNSIGTLAENHPKNYALLQLIEDIPDVRDGRYPDVCQVGVVNEDRESFLSAMEALGEWILLWLNLFLSNCNVYFLLYCCLSCPPTHSTYTLSIAGPLSDTPHTFTLYTHTHRQIGPVPPSPG